MISGLSIFFMVVSAAIILLVPLTLSIVFYKRYRFNISAIFIGALTFTVFQIVLRIPILGLLQNVSWYQSMMMNILAAALFLGFTAGLFEEVGRYIMFKLMMKKRLSWENGLAFGIGHGGIEALLLVGPPILLNIVMSILINQGMADTILSFGIPDSQLPMIESMRVGTAPLMFLAGGLERVLAIMMHIAFSIIVIYGLRINKLKYLIIAILLHAFVDTTAVLLTSSGVNMWIIELYIAVLAVAGVIYAFRLRTAFPKEECCCNSCEEHENQESIPSETSENEQL